MAKEAVKSIVQNRRARYEYSIEDNLEAGIVLKGTEVKSLRQGKVNLLDCFAVISGGEIFIRGMHISPYDHGNIFNVEPLRDRKLLLHKSEIVKLGALISQKGFTIIPLSMYFKKGKVKVDLGVAKGKKLYDKRDDIAKRDSKREIDRWVKEKEKY